MPARQGLDPEEESVGRSVYENLVRLTFLCGRGLDLHELMGRFLKAMRPAIPAEALWLWREGSLFASATDADDTPPIVPVSLPALVPAVQPDGLVFAYVMPGVVLGCRLPQRGVSVQRANDVILLLARILALAWQAETVGRPESWPDDYVAAKSAFKRRWMKELLERSGGNVSEAARNAGVSRAYLYTTMQQLGMS